MTFSIICKLLEIKFFYPFFNVCKIFFFIVSTGFFIKAHGMSAEPSNAR